MASFRRGGRTPCENGAGPCRATPRPAGTQELSVALQLLDRVMEYRMSLEDRIGDDADESWVSVFRNTRG